MLERLPRPFLRRDFGAQERIGVGPAHHAIAQCHAPHPMRDIATPGYAPIARWSAADAQQQQVSLESLGQFQKATGHYAATITHIAARVMYAQR